MNNRNILLPLLAALIAGCVDKGAVQPMPRTPTQPPAVPATHTQVTLTVVDGVAGYLDTPMEPDGKWHVHDPARPQPRIVTPGPFSQNATPPSDAIVLFNGKDLAQWRNKRTGEAAPWPVEDGVATAAKDDIMTTNEFGDMQLHLEFREPTPPGGTGQGRGNSGVFLLGRYEIQVLDCHDNKTYPDGATAAIYGEHPALVNACRLPGEWQTYDIIFNVPHFDARGKLLTPGYVTVFHNGVVAQNHQAIRNDPPWQSAGGHAPNGVTGPLALQFHKNAVCYRNIWIRPVAVNNEP